MVVSSLGGSLAVNLDLGAASARPRMHGCRALLNADAFVAKHTTPMVPVVSQIKCSPQPLAPPPD